MFDFERKEFEDMIKIFKLGYDNANKIFTEKRRHYEFGMGNQKELYGRTGMFQYKKEREYKVAYFNAITNLFDALWNWTLQSRMLFEQDKTYYMDFKKQNEYLCKRFVRTCVYVLKVDVKAVEEILNEIKKDFK